MFYSDQANNLTSGQAKSLGKRKASAPARLEVKSFQGRSYTADVRLKRTMSDQPRSKTKRQHTSDRPKYNVGDYIAIKLEIEYTENQLKVIEWSPATILEFIGGSKRQMRVCHDDGEFYTYDLIQLEQTEEIKFQGDNPPTEDLIFEDVERDLLYSINTRNEYKRSPLSKTAVHKPTPEYETIALQVLAGFKKPVCVQAASDVDQQLSDLRQKINSLVTKLQTSNSSTHNLCAEIKALTGVDTLADAFKNHPTILTDDLLKTCEAHSDLLIACKAKQKMRS